jgi:serine/threonine protein kinase
MILCNLRRRSPHAAGIMDSSPPPSDPFHGLNPADLMAAAAMPTDGGADTLPLSRADLPTVAEIAAAFPDLEILELIGHGGMSAVFKARQPRLDRVVALKVLPKSLAATPGFAERFTREGRVLARLSHPGIVTVHDFGESGGFCYLIMEYVDGANLRQAMRAGRFTPEQALGIVPVMCDALQYAHSQGVLHRDIKPENILIDARGRVKIVDFGIAKILDEKGGDSLLLTHSGARLGTAPYMAPEQIEKPASVDHRADIYSLGVVFYEMLTGELPLGRFAAPSEKSAVSGGMDEVVFRALAKEREHRQQSAGEFKTQVEGATLAPASHSGRQASETQRRTLKLGGAVAGSVFVCANVIFLRHFFQAPQPDWPRTVLPWVLVNAGGFSLVLNLFLWLRLVPVNRIYGVQSPATLSCPRRWYEVNAFFGKHACGWSLVICAAGIAGFYQLPRHQDAYVWAAIALALVGVAASVVSTLVWIRRHPVGGPEIKPHRLARNIELLIPALVLAFFIKSFICASYFIPNGGEPGVAKGSHWMASRLNTGFAPGDLIAYQHESGQTWLARVVAVEPKGLRLKRGGSPDEFSVPWDKVMGKMLFSYFSPDAVKPNADTSPNKSDPASVASSHIKNFPPAETTSHALQQEPHLLFLRMVPNGQPWSEEVYDTAGHPHVLTKEERRIIRSTTTEQISPETDACWLQAWIQHPDLDAASEVSVQNVDAAGHPDKNKGVVFWNDFTTGYRPAGGPVHSVVLYAGKRGSLPRTIDLAFTCSLGPWDSVKRLDKSLTLYSDHSTGDWIASGVGEGTNHECFVTWLRRREDRQVQCVAFFNDGSKLAGMNFTTTGGGHISVRADFGVRLNKVEHFELWARDIRKVTFPHVMLPPLPSESANINKVRSSHDSPDAPKAGADASQAAPAALPIPPVSNGTALALDQKPVLRFTRLYLNGQSWQWPVYSPDGKPLDDEASRRLVTTSSGDASISDSAADCWLQLFFEHPDFDPHSAVGIEIKGPDGSPLKERSEFMQEPGRGAWRPNFRLLMYQLSPGRAGKLPSEVQITLRYCIGPWHAGKDILRTNHFSEVWLGKGCTLAAIGDDSDHHAFASWFLSSGDTQFDLVARLKNGTTAASMQLMQASRGAEPALRKTSFQVSLSEIESFQPRDRKIQSVTFPHVVIPPLP